MCHSSAWKLTLIYFGKRKKTFQLNFNTMSKPFKSQKNNIVIKQVKSVVFGNFSAEQWTVVSITQLASHWLSWSSTGNLKAAVFLALPSLQLPLSSLPIQVLSPSCPPRSYCIPTDMKTVRMSTYKANNHHPTFAVIEFSLAVKWDGKSYYV